MKSEHWDAYGPKMSQVRPFFHFEVLRASIRELHISRTRRTNRKKQIFTFVNSRCLQADFDCIPKTFEDIPQHSCFYRVHQNLLYQAWSSNKSCKETYGVYVFMRIISIWEVVTWWFHLQVLPYLPHHLRLDLWISCLHKVCAESSSPSQGYPSLAVTVFPPLVSNWRLAGGNSIFYQSFWISSLP